ncbi:YadA-like family protein [Pasteurella canis]|uniref:YadA-like family protein n=1 Tax=Pasteurella canis TaxID=753 RepID=UPI001D0F5F59|nr:YadA-like family protein [Pasteurella canis]UDW84473.1 YadA-like family protein [Pasteurella canis]
MNLSKIAVGVAVSLCLVSNVTLADTQKDDLKSSSESKPVVESSSSTKEEAKPADNINNLSLTDKAKNHFLESYKKNDIDNILPKDLVAKSEASKNQANRNQSGRAEPRARVVSGPFPYPDYPQDNQKWKAEWSKLTNEQQKAVLRTHGYLRAYQFLNHASTSKRPFFAALFYSLDILNDDVNKALSEAKVNKESIDVNKETIGKFEKSLETLTGLIDVNKQGIETNKESIKSNKEVIKVNKENITKNTANIDVNKAKIELNHKAIQDVKSQLNSRLDNLNKDLRRGLATQSALTGLFQPYSVGKMNVTAAVGGYQSEKAIAVGSGYRFNDNFAAKVGLSKSLGGSAVSYNMGVNYEF